MTHIQSPEQRVELANLYALSNPEYQQRVWVDNIGWMLRDRAEADLVTAVIEAIDAVLVKHGSGLSDAEYIATPEWGTVIEAASAALAVIPDSEKARRR